MSPETLPPDTPYLAQLKTLPSTLVFIMGCHRSGTSLLHHLLAYTGQVNYVTTYDVVHYDSIIFYRNTGREADVKAALQQRLGAEKNRGLDNLPVGVDHPLECQAAAVGYFGRAIKSFSTLRLRNASYELTCNSSGARTSTVSRSSN